MVPPTCGSASWNMTLEGARKLETDVDESATQGATALCTAWLRQKALFAGKLFTFMFLRGKGSEGSSSYGHQCFCWNSVLHFPQEQVRWVLGGFIAWASCIRDLLWVFVS